MMWGSRGSAARERTSPPGGPMGRQDWAEAEETATSNRKVTADRKTVRERMKPPDEDSSGGYVGARRENAGRRTGFRTGGVACPTSARPFARADQPKTISVPAKEMELYRSATGSGQRSQCSQCSPGRQS